MWRDGVCGTELFQSAREEWSLRPHRPRTRTAALFGAAGTTPGMMSTVGFLGGDCAFTFTDRDAHATPGPCPLGMGQGACADGEGDSTSDCDGRRRKRSDGGRVIMVTVVVGGSCGGFPIAARRNGFGIGFALHVPGMANRGRVSHRCS